MIDLDDGFDLTEEETTEEPITEIVEDTTETPAVEEVETATEPSFKLPFKFDHTEGELTDMEEAKNLVQLGMLYRSKVQPEYEQLKGIRGDYDSMKELADRYGMDVKTLVNTLNDQYIQSQAESTGLTAEQIRKDQELQAREKQIQAQMSESEKKDASAQMYIRFNEKYPGVDPKSISVDTWKRVDNGEDLTFAYTQQINRELTDRLTKLEQSQKNKASSPGVGVTANGGAEPPKNIDPFEEGFDSE